MKTKMYKKLGPKSPFEIQVYLPERWMKILRAFSSQHEIPIRRILLKVLSNPKRIQVPDQLTRPRYFFEPMHRFLMGFPMRQKKMIFNRIRLAQFEFGPYLRFLLEEYIDDLNALLKKTEGYDLDYSPVMIVESKPRKEIFDQGQKWHVFTYEIWGYIPERLREQKNRRRLMAQRRDLYWYHHFLTKEMRKRHKEELE